MSRARVPVTPPHRHFIAATGWNALVKLDEELVKIPLACFEVFYQGQVAEAIGLSFTTVTEKGKAYFSSCIEPIDLNAGFVGYLAPGQTIEQFVKNHGGKKNDNIAFTTAGTWNIQRDSTDAGF